MAQAKHPSKELDPRKGRGGPAGDVPLDLNAASVEEIEALPLMDEVRARKIVNGRPFRSWDDVRAVPELSGIVDDLMRGLASLGPLPDAPSGSVRGDRIGRGA